MLFKEVYQIIIPQLPQSSEGSKAISDMDFKAQMSIFGVMTHNHQLDLYPWMHVVKSDSNVALTCILQTLERYGLLN